MGDLTRENEISSELDSILTGLLLEVYAGVTKKEDALEILAAMKAKIMPAIIAIDKTAANIRGN